MKNASVEGKGGDFDVFRVLFRNADGFFLVGIDRLQGYLFFL